MFKRDNSKKTTKGRVPYDDGSFNLQDFIVKTSTRTPHAGNTPIRNGSKKSPALSTSGDPVKASAALRCAIDELKSFDVMTIKQRPDPRAKALTDRINNTLADIFGRDTDEYDNHSIWSLDTLPVTIGGAWHPLSQVREGYRKGITDAVAKLSPVLEKLEKSLPSFQKPENRLPGSEKEEKQKATPQRQSQPPSSPMEKVSLVTMRGRFRDPRSSDSFSPNQQKIKHEFVRSQARNPDPPAIKAEPPQPDLNDTSPISTAPSPCNQKPVTTITLHIDKNVLGHAAKNAPPIEGHNEISGQITSIDTATTTPARQSKDVFGDNLSPVDIRTDRKGLQEATVSHETLPKMVGQTPQYGEVIKSLHQPIKKPAFLSDLEKMFAELEEQEAVQDGAGVHGKEEEATESSAEPGDKPAPMDTVDENAGIQVFEELRVPEEPDYGEARGPSSAVTQEQKTALTALQERLKQLVAEEPVSDESDLIPVVLEEVEAPILHGDAGDEILFIDADSDTEQLVLDEDAGEEILFIDGDHNTEELILDGDTDVEVLILNGDGVLAKDAFDKPLTKPVLLENLEKRLAELEEQEAVQDGAGVHGKEEEATESSAEPGDKPAPMDTVDENARIQVFEELRVPEEPDYGEARGPSSAVTQEQKTALTALQERLKQLVAEEPVSDESDLIPVVLEEVEAPILHGDAGDEILFIDADSDTEQLVLDEDAGEEILFIDGDHNTGELFLEIPEQDQIDTSILVLDGGDKPPQEIPNEPTASSVLLETLERKLKHPQTLKPSLDISVPEDKPSTRERLDQLSEEVTITCQDTSATEAYHPEHNLEMAPPCDQSINGSTLLEDSNEIQQSLDPVQTESKDTDALPILYASEYLLAGQKPYTFLTGQEETAVEIFPSEEPLPEIFVLHEQEALHHLVPLSDIFENESLMPDADGPIAENIFGPSDPQGDGMMIFEALQTVADDNSAPSALPHDILLVEPTQLEPLPQTQPYGQEIQVMCSETLLAEEAVSSLPTEGTDTVLWEMADANPIQSADMQALLDDNPHMPVADLVYDFPEGSMQIPVFKHEVVNNEVDESLSGEPSGSATPDTGECPLTAHKDASPVMDEVQQTNRETTTLVSRAVLENTQYLTATVYTRPTNETSLLEPREGHEFFTERPVPQKANTAPEQRFSESTEKSSEDPSIPPQEPVMPRTMEVSRSPFAVPGFSSVRGQSKVVRTDVLDAHIAELRCRIDDLKSFDVTAIKERFDPGAKALGDAVSNTLATIFGRNTPAYWQHAIPSLDTVLVVVGGPKPSPDEVQDAYRRGINEAVAKLTATIETLDEKRRKLAAPGPDAMEPNISPDPPADIRVYNFPPREEISKDPPQEPVMPRTMEVSRSPFAVPGFSSVRGQSKVVRTDVLDAHIAELRCRIDDLKSFDVTAIKERFDPGAKALGDAVSNTLATIFGRNTPAYWQHAIPSLDTVLVVVGGPKPSPDEVQDAYRRGINEAVAKLTATIETLDEKRRKLAAQAAC
ncbi:MAG: hypothetical protein A4E65_01982 [Syntrophorhabdus sp. PtaU1.Bin153]|nr:MAG: hypothetical protein A4E65_01982 [Syntrophorhabdus sp. PtaU1.Bin153]